MLREALVATRDNYYYVPLHHQLRPWAMKRNVTAVHNAVDRHEARYTRID
jgi:peptide/nickel transport system substrate-binding protein